MPARHKFVTGATLLQLTCTYVIDIYINSKDMNSTPDICHLKQIIAMLCSFH